MKQLHQEKLQKARSAIKNRRTALFQRHTKGQGHPFLQPPPPPQELPPPPPPKTTRPWSKLPLPFVKHLLRRLHIPDYIRFSSVCHAWHISKKRAQTLPSQQLPWLLLARHVEDPSLTFYSLSEDRSYRIPFPNIIGSKCVSAVRGWLLFQPNLSAMPATVSRLLLNPLLDILHEFPNNSLAPPIINAAAIIDSPSPNNPQGFWVFFAGGRSILFWNPVENVKFRKVIDHDEFWLEILDMTAEGEKLYYITDDLDLFEYNHRSNSTKPLIQNHHGDYPAQPSVENNHFLMIARVGEERKVLMAVVVYDLEVSSEKAKGVDWVELFTPRGGEWVRVEAVEYGDLVLFLSYRAASFCVSATEMGGRGGRVYLVPDEVRADSISKARGVEELMWVEIDLVSGDVAYKEEKKSARMAKKRRIQVDPLLPPSPEPQQPQMPGIKRRLLFPLPQIDLEKWRF